MMTAVSPDQSQHIRSAALRKVTWRLIPFLFVLYVVAWLDRVNVGFAALQMNGDLHFSDTAFGIGSGVFFLGYCLFEVPSNLILARVGARLWISRIMITWGFISASMMFVRTPAMFCFLRFLLGAAEAGFFPGVVFYLSHWYPVAHRARAIARFMTAVPVTALIGGPLSGALLDLRGVGGLAGWQWLFLAEGIPAVLLGVVVLVYLTDNPQTAGWLTDAERESLIGELWRENRSAVEGRIAAGLKHPLVWLLGIVFVLSAAGFYAYSLWAPILIKSMTGTSNLGIGWITAAIGAATIVFMLLNGRHSDRTRERRLHITIPLLVMAVGFVLCPFMRNPALAVMVLALIPIGHCSAYGPFWSLPTEFLSGRAAAAGTALVVTIANIGGFAGPALTGYVKQRTGSYAGSFFVLAALSFIAAVLSLWLRVGTHACKSAEANDIRTSSAGA